ncbi:hypothetical protein GCM10009830_19170 [Glycomyces endophyticus]|uniref:Uncharacterized protein n=1 Tax=Glycomyces endophyticus TaxID=480996 RepID=A0ABP4SKB9_9ACTN
MNDAARTTAPASPVTALSAILWGLAPIAWLAAFFTWLFVSADAMDSGGRTAVGDAVAVVLLGLPAPWLLWASWRMPRPRLDAYLAEAGALATMLASLYIATLNYMISPPAGPGPIALTVVYLAGAAVLLAAAWPLPGRRIAYGTAALACVVLGVGFRMGEEGSLFRLDIGFLTQDELFAAVLLGLPAVGAVLEAARWAVGRLRA